MRRIKIERDLATHTPVTEDILDKGAAASPHPLGCG